MASDTKFSDWYFAFSKEHNRTPSQEEVWNAALAQPAPVQAGAQQAVADEQIRRLFVEHGHLYAGWLELARSILSLRTESPAAIYTAPTPASDVAAWLNPETGDCVSVKCKADWAFAYGENAGNVYSVPLIAALAAPTQAGAGDAKGGA